MSFWLESLPFWIALVPLGVYCCVMGGLQLRHRPLVMSASWDSALLGIALSGLVASSVHYWLLYTWQSTPTAPLRASLVFLYFCLLYMFLFLDF